MNEAFYKIPIQTMDESITTLESYHGQILLIVNVASRCGFTPQYAELETLQRDYHTQGFSVLGFPCDQFLHQEPGNNAEIQTFADQCFRITFPLFAKIQVNGQHRAPLYTYLAKHIQKKPLKLVPWNFCKILVDQQGNVLKRYLPITSFKKLRHDIESLLKNNPSLK